MRFIALLTLLALLGAQPCAAAPEADRILALPGWNDALPSPQYSGYLDLPGTKKHIHYWFIASESPTPSTDSSSPPYLNASPTHEPSLTTSHMPEHGGGRDAVRPADPYGTLARWEGRPDGNANAGKGSCTRPTATHPPRNSDPYGPGRRRTQQ